MDYNEYLEKHSESIFHYCLPAKPGTKVIVRNPQTPKEEYVPAIIKSYYITDVALEVQLYLEQTGFMFFRSVTEFGKTIFIGSVVEE